MQISVVFGSCLCQLCILAVYYLSYDGSYVSHVISNSCSKIDCTTDVLSATAGRSFLHVPSSSGPSFLRRYALKTFSHFTPLPLHTLSLQFSILAPFACLQDFPTRIWLLLLRVHSILTILTILATGILTNSRPPSHPRHDSKFTDPPLCRRRV